MQEFVIGVILNSTWEIRSWAWLRYRQELQVVIAGFPYKRTPLYTYKNRKLLQKLLFWGRYPETKLVDLDLNVFYHDHYTFYSVKRQAKKWPMVLVYYRSTLSISVLDVFIEKLISGDSLWMNVYVMVQWYKHSILKATFIPVSIHFLLYK